MNYVIICQVLKQELEKSMRGGGDRGSGGERDEEWREGLRAELEAERRRGEEELRGEILREVGKLRGEVAEVKAGREGRGRGEERRGAVEDKFQVTYMGGFAQLGLN